MVKLDDKEYRKMLDLVYRANSCENTKDFYQHVCPLALNIFNVECVSLSLINGFSSPSYLRVLDSKAFRSLNKKVVEDSFSSSLYKNIYYKDSPLLKKAISSSKTIFKVGDSIPINEWEQSSFYRSFITPQNLYWGLFLALRYKNHMYGMVSLWRSDKRLDFKNDEISKAKIITPHLALALHKSYFIASINESQRRHFRTEDATNKGLLLFNNRLKLINYNKKAEEILELLYNSNLYNCYSGANKTLPVPDLIVKDCSDLLNTVNICKSPVLLPKERIMLNVEGRKFKVESTLVWKANKMHITPNFMVTLSEITESQILYAQLQNRLSLSKREFDIIIGVLNGLSCKEISKQLFISEFTVRTHVRNIYQKLAVKNRVELYRNYQWLLVDKVV